MSDPLSLALDETAGVMPQVSPAADMIAQKVINEKSDKNATPQKVPPKEKNKRGRPKGTTKQTPATSNGSRLGGLANPEQRDMARRATERAATAAFAADMIERSGVVFAGDQGKMHEIEKAGLAACFDRYFEAKNIADLPPGVALVMVMGQYYARVMMSEPARPKVAILWDALKLKFKRKKKNARSDNRNDGQRENDTGENAAVNVSHETDPVFGIRPLT